RVPVVLVFRVRIPDALAGAGDEVLEVAAGDRKLGRLLRRLDEVQRAVAATDQPTIATTDPLVARRSVRIRVRQDLFDLRRSQTIDVVLGGDVEFVGRPPRQHNDCIARWNDRTLLRVDLPIRDAMDDARRVVSNSPAKRDERAVLDEAEVAVWKLP